MGGGCSRACCCGRFAEVPAYGEEGDDDEDDDLGYVDALFCHGVVCEVVGVCGVRRIDGGKRGDCAGADEVRGEAGRRG